MQLIRKNADTEISQSNVLVAFCLPKNFKKEYTNRSFKTYKLHIDQSILKLLCFYLQLARMHPRKRVNTKLAANIPTYGDADIICVYFVTSGTTRQIRANISIHTKFAKVFPFWQTQTSYCIQCGNQLHMSTDFSTVRLIN